MVNLKGKTIVVTGGCGYIGSNIVYKLLECGARVYIIDDFSILSKFDERFDSILDCIDKDYMVYMVDLKDYGETIRTLSRIDCIDAIIHLASSVVVSESVKAPLFYYNNNINSLINILRCNFTKNVIFASSACVYGKPSKSIVDEFQPSNCSESPYASTKIACEQLMIDAVNAYDLNAITFRFFNVAGANNTYNAGIKLSNPTHLVPNVVKCALGMIPELNVYSCNETPDKTCIRDYVHVEDIAEANVLGLKYLFDTGLDRKLTTLNLCSGRGHSVKEVIDLTNKILGTNLKYVMKPPREGDCPVVVGDYSLAKNIIGFEPERTIENIIEDTSIFYKKILDK